MKTKFYFIQIPIVLFALAGGLSSCVHATVTRIEAETNPTAGDMKIMDDETASGGKAVSMPRDWQPLFKADLPEGDAFTIWTRHKAGSILMKRYGEDGKQKDLKWIYDKPAELKWTKVGRWSREEIGKGIVIIRGGGGGQGPILDAVVFATDENYNPNVDGSTPTLATTEKKTEKKDDQANLGEGGEVALGIKDKPSGAFFEAEEYSTGSVVEADGASGGQAVKSDRDWQPLVSIPLPEGDAWKLWIRHKGGPMAIKTKVDGKGKDRWVWNKPGKWEWRETDVFSREDLGGKNLVIGRDGGGTKSDTVLIDAVVLASEKKRDLPPSQPDPKLAPQKISASIDWSKQTGVLLPTLWGINEQQVLDPKNAGDAAYQKLLGELNPPLIRIHQVDLIKKWTNAETRDWDVEKIKAAFESSSGYGDAKLMICISELPPWIAGGHPSKMTEADQDAFAALCARLVKIMRADVKRKVDYWEVINEWDNQMEKAGRLENLWRAYNKCAAAMRKEDAQAKIGGFAFTWAKPQWINGFLENCPDAQFVSWHNYATGDLFESNEKILNDSINGNIGGLAQGVLNALEKHNRPMETFLTETNVKYTWDPYERRHQNTVGSIFHALVVNKMAQLGVTGVTLWVQKGNSYGSLIDSENKTHPSYELYRWGAKHLNGKLVASRTDDAQSLEVIAVEDGDKKAVLLLNKTPGIVIVPGAAKWIGNAKAQRLEAGGAVAAVEMNGGDLTLPGFSLTLLHQ